MRVWAALLVLVDATVQRTVLETLDKCLARAKTLDPVFRRWLAPRRG